MEKRAGTGGHALYEKLKERGILVRHFDEGRIADFIRVSIGTRAQMDQFLGAVRDILGEE